MPQTPKTDLRLFLSSTFRDMQEEREYLLKKVFPEIRSLCRSRGVTFTEVDLRWGLTNEQQRLGRIVQTCLDEIDKCKPCFIGMLGTRYGWSPEYHEVLMDPDILDRYPWIEDISLQGGSLLEMEFTFGLETGSSDTTFFYRRNVDGSAYDEPEKIDALIKKVESLHRPFTLYSTPEELGEIVRTDLIKMIDESWPLSEAPTPLEIERRAHQAFAQSRRRAYIPNLEYLTQFTNWLKSSDSPLIVSSDSGNGKSALLAWLAGEYARKTPNGFVIEHYVGCSDDSTDHLGFIRHVMGEVRERYNISEEIPTDVNTLENKFSEWLGYVGATEGYESDELVIILDAVDQLVPHSRSFTWLPKVFPKNVKLIVSCRTGEMLSKLTERGWERLELRELKIREREAIVTRYLAEYHKALPSELLQRVATDEKGASPLFLRTIAEELRLYGEHESLSKKVEEYLIARNLEEVFIKMLERMETDYGHNVVRSVTTALALSRSGLTEAFILKAADILRVELSMLLVVLDYHLLRSNGRISFFHNYLQRAVESRYLTDNDHAKEGHARLAAISRNEYERLIQDANEDIDPALVREMLYQYMMADDLIALKNTLLEREVFDLMFESESEHEFLQYWNLLRAENVVDDYEHSFAGSVRDAINNANATTLLKLARFYRIIGAWSDAEKLLETIVSSGQRASNELLIKAWGNLGELQTLRGEHSKALQSFTNKLERARKEGREDIAAITESEIGSILFEQGKYEDAMTRFETALDVSKATGDKVTYARILQKIGQVHFALSRHDEALMTYSQCLDYFESLGNKRMIAATLGHIGLVHWHNGEFDEAMKCFTEEMKYMRSIGDLQGVAVAAGKTGLVRLDEGRLDEANTHFNEYLDITKDLGYSRGIGYAYGDIGLVHLQKNEIEKALDYFDKALSIHRDINYPEGVATWLKWKVNAALEHYNASELNVEIAEEARMWLAECLRVSRAIGHKHLVFDAEVLAARLAHLDNPEHAAELLKHIEHTNGFQDAEVAYWLWKYTHNDIFRLRASDALEALSRTSKKHIFLTRLKELAA